MTAGLLQRSITAAGWGMIGSVLKILLQIGAQIVLARLLGPDQYGVFAVGVLVVTFGNYFSDSGIAYGLVQHQDITNTDIRFVLTWQLLLGGIVAGGIALLAPVLAQFFREPRAELVLQVVSCVCLLNALATPSINLLKRKLDYRSLQVAQVFAYFLGYVCVGIPLAIYGFGVWALVWAWVVLAAVQLLLLYKKTRHPLVPLLWFDGAGRHMSFGGLVMATNLLNWFMSNVDKAIAARFFPGANLGLYSNSFTLLNTPTTVIYSTLQSVLFSATARIQNQVEAQRSGYLKLMGLLSAIFFPAFLSLGLVSATLVQSFYGDAWAGAAPVMTAFAFAMPLLLIWGVSTPVLWNNGRARFEIILQIPLVLPWLISAYFAVQYSVVLLAWAMAAFLLVRVILITFYVAKILRVGAHEYVRAMAGPLLSGLILAWCVAALDAGLLKAGTPVFIVLLLDVMAGMALLAASIYFVRVSMSQPARELAQNAVTRLPGKLRLLASHVLKGFR